MYGARTINGVIPQRNHLFGSFRNPQRVFVSLHGGVPGTRGSKRWTAGRIKGQVFPDSHAQAVVVAESSGPAVEVDRCFDLQVQGRRSPELGRMLPARKADSGGPVRGGGGDTRPPLEARAAGSLGGGAVGPMAGPHVEEDGAFRFVIYSPGPRGSARHGNAPSGRGAVNGEECVGDTGMRSARTPREHG